MHILCSAGQVPVIGDTTSEGEDIFPACPLHSLHPDEETWARMPTPNVIVIAPDPPDLVEDDVGAIISDNESQEAVIDTETGTEPQANLPSQEIGILYSAEDTSSNPT